MPGKVSWVAMRAEHLAAVAALEAKLFPRPWRVEHFLHELHRNQLSENYILAQEGSVLGYVSVWFLYDELQINKIAVDTVQQRRGYGGRLMRELLSLAEGRGCESVTLEVREGNLEARALYDQFGFQVTGRRRDYYGPGEDALLMALEC